MPFSLNMLNQKEGYKNGRYEPETNTIYIDINAGINETQRILVDQVLPTVSHELVHIFAVEDSAGFAQLADLVFAGLKESTGNTRSYLINEEIKRILEKDPNRFEGESEETRRAIAEEEIVARSCEDRLANSRLMKKFIEEMENKESGLSQKFSNFLGEAIARLKKIFQQIAAKLSYSKEAQSLRKLTDHLEAIQSQYDALLERRTTEATTAPSEQQKNTSGRGVMNAERNVAKNKKTGYNEYRTNAMQWANSFGRSQDDRAIFFDPVRNNYYFIAPDSDSDMGYIELAFGTKNEMEEINKEYGKERTRNSIDKNIQETRPEERDDDWAHDISQYRGKARRNDRLSSSEEKKGGNPNRTRNPSRTWKNPGSIEESDKKGTMKAERDSGGNVLSEDQKKYFIDSKVRDENGNLLIMYHGTPNAVFTKFRPGTYFTQHKWYADAYQSPGASSLGYKRTAEKPDTYEVYLNIKKPFDTRNKTERDIFYNEFYGKWGTGTDLMESGLPDWMDGLDLLEFLEEMGYDYDGFILDEGGVGGYGDEVKSRGISYVVMDPSQVKRIDNRNPTSDPDIRYADRATYDSAREMLLAAAEEAEKEKIGKSQRTNPRHKYLAEYKNRVETLDRKYANLEKAETEYLSAMDSGKEDLGEKIYKRIAQKTNEINRLERDLQAQEKSKELVRAYNEQVREWWEAKHKGEALPKPERPDSLEFNLIGMIRREKNETRAQALKEGRAITREKLGDYRDSIERKSTQERIEAKTKLLK